MRKRSRLKLSFVRKVKINSPNSRKIDQFTGKFEERRHPQPLPLRISYSPGAFRVNGLSLSFVVCGFSVLQMM